MKVITKHTLNYQSYTEKHSLQLKQLKQTHMHQIKIYYTKSFLPLWMRVLQCSIDVLIVVGGFLLESHLMKWR